MKSKTPAKISRNKPSSPIKTIITIDDEKYLPRYKNDQASYAELAAKIPSVVQNGMTLPARVILNHRASMKVMTGAKITVPEGFKLCVSALDSLAEKGLIVSNSPGQVNTLEEIIVLVVNVGRELVEIKDGDKIAKLWLEPVYRFEWSLN